MLALLDEVAPEVILVVLLLVKSGNFLVQRSSGNGSSNFKLKDYQQFSLLGKNMMMIFFFQSQKFRYFNQNSRFYHFDYKSGKRIAALPLKTLFVAGNE